MSYEVTSSYIINGISGIWNSYGCPIEIGDGLSINLEENEVSDESLINLVGFDTDQRHIGLLNNDKQIAELVVLLPMLQYDIEYTEEPTTTVYTPPKDPCEPCEDKTTDCENDTKSSGWIWKPEYLDKDKFRDRLQYNRTEDAWLFVIDPKIINKILGVSNYKSLSITAVKDILDTKTDLNNDNNIVKLMKAMVKFNFPPHLNWLLFHSLPCYAMYTAEFSATLSKKDLSNIWQGTMPDLAQNPQEEEIVIEHFLDDEEIFGGIDISELNDIKMSIFKCKMRAENSYVNMLKQTQKGERKEWYQYNWPYDNFSLVELLKVEAGEVREFIKPEDAAQSVIITTPADENGQSKQYTLSKEEYNKWVAANAPYTKDLYE